MRLIHLLGFTSVHHPVHGEAHAGPDGVFDVGTDFGHALLANRAHWATEDEHVAAQAAAQLADLADPNKTPHVLLELRNAYARTDERLRAIEEHLGLNAAVEPTPAPAGETSTPAAGGTETPTEDGQGGTQTPSVPDGTATTETEPPLTRQQKAAATRAANKAAAATADTAPPA